MEKLKSQTKKKESNDKKKSDGKKKAEDKNKQEPKKRNESKMTKFVRGAAKYARAASVAFGAMLSIAEALRNKD